MLDLWGALHVLLFKRYQYRYIYSKVSVPSLKHFFEKSDAVLLFIGMAGIGIYVYSSFHHNFSPVYSKGPELRKMLEKSDTNFKQFYNEQGFTDEKAYIAHGSGVNEYVYTDCCEGIADSIQRGFKFIELDLLVTSDNVIIGGHDWQHFKQLIGEIEINDEALSPLSYDMIRNKKINGTYTVVSSKEICQFLEKYPDFYLVTDKIRDYTLLLEQIPFPDRLVVEVFSFEDYYRALLAGIKYPAYCFTLDKKCFAAVLKNKIPMITVSSRWIFNEDNFKEKLKKLHESGVVILCYHHIDEACEKNFMRENMGKLFSKFYVDRDYREIIKENMQ